MRIAWYVVPGTVHSRTSIPGAQSLRGCDAWSGETGSTSSNDAAPASAAPAITAPGTSLTCRRNESLSRMLQFHTDATASVSLNRNRTLLPAPDQSIRSHSRG